MSEKSFDTTVFAWGADGDSTINAEGLEKPVDLPEDVEERYANALPSLAVLKGETKDCIFDLRPGEMILGRHPSDHMVLLNGDISRHHVKFTVSQDGSSVTVEPNKPMATFNVDGNVVREQTPLKGGELIQIGDECALRFYGRGDSRRYPYDQKQQQHYAPFSNCFNKDYFFYQGELLFARCLFEEREISMVLMETRGIAKAGAEHGEAVQNELLRQVGTFLWNNADLGGSLVGHVSDAGFAILLPGINANITKSTVDKLEKWFSENSFNVDGKSIAIEVVLGFSTRRASENRLDDLTKSTAFSLKSNMMKKV